MKHIYKVFIITLMFFLLVSCKSDNPYIPISPSNNEILNEKTSILVDIKGAINFPNVYEIKVGTILYELINLAGGLTPNADISNINLATIISDNQMIIIPEKKVVNEEDSVKDGLININSATLSDLCTIPGIGAAKANNIINYRNEHGFFISITEIKNVSGIGDELYNKIKEYICV